MTQSTTASSRPATPPGRIGIWLFLASEIMFFMGLLVSYVLFRASEPALFASQSAVMNKWAGGINTLILLSSSFMLAFAAKAAAQGNRRNVIASLAMAVLLAAGFLGIKAWEYRDKLTHYTLVTRAADGKMTIYDGHVQFEGENLKLRGYAAPMSTTSDWDIHLTTQAQVQAAGDGIERQYNIPAASILERINDGPWKNMFFACYFTLTAVHAVHLIGGIIAALALLTLASRGKILPAATEYVGIYWHFVDLVWIFLFVLLYLS